jgi:hypothetical protein
MKRSDRLAARLGSILSVVLGVYGLAVMPIPFGVVGGSVAALFGLAFGVLGLLANAWGRWRTAARAGIVISSLALVVAAPEVVVFIFLG